MKPLLTNESGEQPPNEAKRRKYLWLRLSVIGAAFLLGGLVFIFSPYTMQRFLNLMLCIVFAFIGLADLLAAFRYKIVGADWPIILANGLTAIVIAVIFFFAFKNSYAFITVLYVTASWALIRSTLELVAYFRGGKTMKNKILIALVLLASGICLFAFGNEIQTVVYSYLGYAFAAAGIIIVFIGQYIRANTKEVREFAQRQSESAQKQKRLEEAAANAEYAEAEIVGANGEEHNITAQNQNIPDEMSSNGETPQDAQDENKTT